MIGGSSEAPASPELIDPVVQREVLTAQSIKAGWWRP